MVGKPSAGKSAARPQQRSATSAAAVLRIVRRLAPTLMTSVYLRVFIKRKLNDTEKQCVYISTTMYNFKQYTLRRNIVSH